MSVIALFRHHVRMLTRPGRLILTSALAALPGLIILVSGLANPTPDEVPGMVANIGATTFPIAALILASATLRNERDDGTLPYLYTSPIPRPTMAAASILSGVTVTALVGLIASVAIALATIAVGVDPTVGIATIPAYLVASLGYAPLFVPAGYLLPRVILVGLAYVILWEQIVARLVTGVANTSVWRFALSVYGDFVEASPDGGLENAMGPVVAGAGGGVLKVLVVAVVGWLVLLWALRRRDAM